MKIKKNGEIINLTESDIKRISKRFLNEQEDKSIDIGGNEISINFIKKLRYIMGAAVGINAIRMGAKERAEFNAFIDSIVNALEVTFKDAPHKLNNLERGFTTLERQLKKVVERPNDVRRNVEDVKNEIFYFVKTNGKSGNKKYYVTDNELNTLKNELNKIEFFDRYGDQDNDDTELQEESINKLTIKKNGEIINLTESDIKRILHHSLTDNKQPINEQVGLLLTAAAIMAYRQTARSQSKRLTKRIKKNLRSEGIKSRKIEDGNLNQLMRCINGWIESNGKDLDGKKRVSKNLVRGKNVKNQAIENFSQKLPNAVKECGKKFGLDNNEQEILSRVIISTIQDFKGVRAL